MMTPLATLRIVLSLSFCAEALGNADHDLARHLIDHYPQPSFMRPVEDMDTAVPLQMDFNLNSIAEFDEDAAQLAVSGYIRLMWVDEFLRWDAEEAGVDHLLMYLHDFWTPEIRLLGMAYEQDSNVLASVYPDGTVFIIPPVTMKTQCEQSEEAHHYDCQFSIGCLIYPDPEVAIALYSNSTGFNAKYFRPYPGLTLDVGHSSAVIVDHTYAYSPDVHKYLDINLHIVHAHHGHHHDH